MLRKALATLGIGGASVDAVLESATSVPGGTLRGRITLHGGRVEQEIRSIEVAVETDYVDEDGDFSTTRTHALGAHRIPGPIRVAPGGRQEIPFAVEVPWGAPLTLGTQRSWMATRLDVEGAVDPRDRDELRILPTPLQARLLDAMQELGFRLRAARNERSRLGRGLPFVQEIEMRAAVGPFRGRLDEVDVIAWPGPGSLDVVLEVDRRARGLGSLLAELAELDESRVRVAFTDADLAHPASEWAARLRAAIEPYA